MRKSALGQRLEPLIHGKKKDFAKEVGISASHLSEILSGKSAPSLLLIKRLADLCRVNEQWLTTGDGPMRGSRVPVLGGRGGVAAHETGKHAAAGPLAPDGGQAGQTIRLEVGGVAVTITVEPAAPKPP